jgi:hypothetical protein
MLIVMEPGAGDPAPRSFWGYAMSLDLESAGFVVSGAAVGLAAASQLWCAARKAVPGRRRRAANRLMTAALLLDLVLAAAATIGWADAGIRGTQTASHPPLLWPLTLLAVGTVASVVANAAQRFQHAQRGSVRQQAT